ncbi:MAG TPA: cytochrome c biogenesis protein CcdA, partial [Nannocystis sp.]
MALFDLLAVSGVGELLDRSPFLAIATLFGAGVLTSLTPCIYPMIPITAGLISGATAGARERPTRRRVIGLT